MRLSRATCVFLPVSTIPVALMPMHVASVHNHLSAQPLASHAVSLVAPNLFDSVPCAALGAVYEGYHKQGWHAMHGRSVCSLYALRESHPAICGDTSVKSARIFNSGVMMLSAAHRPLLAGWDARKLQCQILCDQLYMNAMVHEHRACVHNLGDAFNLPGTQVRKMMATTDRDLATAGAIPSLHGTAVATSCFLHLTVLPAKQYTSHCTQSSPMLFALYSALPSPPSLQPSPLTVVLSSFTRTIHRPADPHPTASSDVEQTS